MSRPLLHLDEDISIRALVKVLTVRGHDVSRTPCAWIEAGASDELQLLRASENGRIVLTGNIRDFVYWSKKYPYHAGVILVHRSKWTRSQLISALDKMLTSTQAEEWVGQVRWLNEWKEA